MPLGAISITFARKMRFTFKTRYDNIAMTIEIANETKLA